MKIYLFSLCASIILIVSGVCVSYFFQNPYPCSASGIGCHNVFEMIEDSWNQYVGIFLFILGLSLIPGIVRSKVADVK